VVKIGEHFFCSSRKPTTAGVSTAERAGGVPRHWRTVRPACRLSVRARRVLAPACCLRTGAQQIPVLPRPAPRPASSGAPTPLLIVLLRGCAVLLLPPRRPGQSRAACG
jgi:hypothetical protein